MTLPEIPAGTAVLLDANVLICASRRLLTNDSLNAACALRSGLSQIATADTDFERVPGLAVFRPADVTVSA